MVLLERGDVVSNSCEVVLLVVSLDDVISAVLLVAGDEVFVIDGW